jgi:hypothetical protein
MIVDLQVNLEGKEGAAEPEALVLGAKNAGLDGILLTKENALIPDVASFKQAGDTHGIRVFAGAKIATKHGIILCVLPNTDTLADDFATQTDGIYDASSVIDAIEAKGGITVALRPYDRDVPNPMGDHLFSLQGLSACEVQNGRVSDVANDLALEAASNMEMPCVGTSCANGVEGLGTAATLFRSAVSNEADLCEAIRSGDCWPVSFSTEVPAQEQGERSGPSRHAGGGERGDRGGERGDRGGGDRDGARRRGRRGGRRRSGERGGADRGPQQAQAPGAGGAPMGQAPQGGDRGGERRGPPGGGERRGGFGGGDRGGDRGAVRTEGARGGRGGRGGRGRGGPGGGGGGGGRGRGGPRPDDFGNRVRQDRGPVDENAGNVVPQHERAMDEDAGNRLRPGEASPYARRPAGEAQPFVPAPHHDDDDDNVGNR